MSDERIARFCYLIGCSGLSKKCPGDPDCSIVRKALGEDISWRISDDVKNRDRESIWLGRSL